MIGFLQALIFILLIFFAAWQISLENLTVGTFFSYLSAGALLIDLVVNRNMMQVIGGVRSPKISEPSLSPQQLNYLYFNQNKEPSLPPLNFSVAAPAHAWV